MISSVYAIKHFSFFTNTVIPSKIKRIYEENFLRRTTLERTETTVRIVNITA